MVATWRSKEDTKAVEQGGSRLQLAFPNGANSPAKCLQLPFRCPIPLSVAFQLWLPIVPSSRWNAGARAPLMVVPEAAMDLDYGSSGWKDQIRRSRQISAVKPKPVARRMQQPPNHHFRLGVLGFVRPHDPSAVIVNVGPGL